MSVIDKIDGDLIRKLSEGQSTESSGESSTLLGLGKGASFDKDKVNLTPGLNTVAQAFTNSYLRLNDAISAISFTKDTLEQILDLTKDLIGLADRALDESTKENQRNRLNTLYQKKVREFRDILTASLKQGVDLLDQNDVQGVLKEAGIDPKAATQLAQIFKKLAGSDQILGYEKFKISDQLINSLKTQIVGNGTFTPGFTRTGAGNGTFTAVQTVSTTGIDAWWFDAVTTGDGTYNAGVSYASGASVENIVTADVNNDGILDYINASSGDDSFNVGLGNGDGSFKLNVSYVTGDEPYSVAVADLNGDRYADIVSASYGDDSVSVAFGNGDGSFTSRRSYSAGNGASFVAIADVNSDGVADVISTSVLDSKTSLFLGNNDGTLKARLSFDGGFGGDTVQVADMNGDGLQDLVVTASAANTVEISLGNGDGSFKNRISSSVGLDLQRAAIRDINGDGKLDIATANRADDISVLISNGDGTFAAQVTYETGNAATDIAFTDIDRDGKVDLIVTTISDSSVSV
ncbi:MAG: VCBS repeat-containing protein, partial [Deltaproteobacteria bacterium]|nr:VCBS repeat-containing protein [Deltaproteobacteria bacterium]